VILLIEDNPADAGLVREALEEHAVEGQLTVIGDGERAISYLASIERDEARCPDLLILDLNLPKRSGSDVLRYVRESKCCVGMPVLILSSSDNRKDRDETALLGATRYLRKPIELDDFLSLGAVFKEVLGQRD
jgi:DNA-binding response OmpR family regulator